MFHNLIISRSRPGPPEEEPEPAGWTITSHIGEMPGGFDWNYKKYVVSPATDNWILQLHGAGEGGPQDGSQLSKVELNGYSKRAASGQAFPFNILAPQGLKEGAMVVPSFTNVKRGALTLLSSLGATKIIPTGYSQGGQQSLDFLWETQAGGTNIWNGHEDLLAGFLIMCGNKSGGQLYADALDRKIMCVHGDADSQINYFQGLAIVNGYNAAGHPDTAVMVTIPGGSHSDAWVRGYNPADTYGASAYAFVLNCFGI